MKRILTVAGSDPTCGAGLQADLLAIAMLGAWPLTAVTAITVQNTIGVQEVVPLPADLVARQMRACLEDVGVDAIKLGMLANSAIIKAVAEVLKDFQGPVVADPVRLATGGGVLLAEEALASYRRDLFPHITLLTPNLAEASLLSGLPIRHPEEMLIVGMELAKEVKSVLVTGGHLPGPEVQDLLCQGQHHQWYRNPRLSVGEVHGTGCTLASSIAVGLAQEMELASSVAMAISVTRHAIAHSVALGKGQRLPWRSYRPL